MTTDILAFWTSSGLYGLDTDSLSRRAPFSPPMLPLPSVTYTASRHEVTLKMPLRAEHWRKLWTRLPSCASLH